MRVAGICFQNYTILPLSEPENLATPCLSCTKQWCLDQKLAICVNAQLGDTNLDTATGKEGDVEARCFREYFHNTREVLMLGTSQNETLPGTSLL